MKKCRPGQIVEKLRAADVELGKGLISSWSIKRHMNLI
jgi:hypothetical protein